MTNETTPAEVRSNDGLCMLDDDEADPVRLWAEIHRLRAAVQGPGGFATCPERATMRLTLADLGVLADTAERNGTMHAFPAVALQWAAGAKAEIERLRRVWEDTRTQRDELLAHLTRGDPLPAWAVEWIRVCKA